MSASPESLAPHYGDPPSLRSRAVSLLLATGITLLILLAFIGLAGKLPEKPQFKGGPVMINLPPDPKAEVDAPKQTANRAQARSRPTTPIPPPIIPPIKKSPIQIPDPDPYILLSKEEYETFDLARPGPAVRRPGTSGQLATASGAGDSKAIGTAPNGEPLYAAQWYRRPTHAELSTYMPANMPAEGSGLVACRTVARYHVDDCVELGSSPPGSHLAGAVRKAAWQFLVRPPRVGGRELVGTWVQIQIDYRTIIKE